MRIGLMGGAATVERMVEQAQRAESDGFTSLWYTSAVGGDPLVAMAMAGKATARIELGTSVLQTYTCHPALQASRALAAVSAMGRPALTLGVGPSHKPVIEDAFGLSYGRPGGHTEEYVRVLGSALRGEAVQLRGEHFRVDLPAAALPIQHRVPLFIAALGPRMLRVAGELTDGTILWMANARAIDAHVAPRIRAAASAAGRPAPRIVAGLPVAVHDDADEARTVAASTFEFYGLLPNYRRILDIGGAAGPADAAIVGDESAVAEQVQGLVDAGATDVWAAIFPVGGDRTESRQRTRALLRELAAA
jgi:F420-dependent oxidoreductase-like protein